jgi:ABC-type sugar transport system ATPase subunit
MIQVSGLCVAAGNFRLNDLSFRIEAGAHAVLSGPSGSGKTTTLEAICGLRKVMAGTIEIAGRDVTDLPPAARHIGFVPQDGALFSHLSVRGNAAFALRIRRCPAAEIGTRIEELAASLGLTHLLDRPIAGLSGGERQRVALARAMAFRPPVLLLDEPFSALDRAARLELREILQRLRSEQGATILHVTHDEADAESLATQIIHHPRP